MMLISAESLRFDLRGLRMTTTGSALREWTSAGGDTLGVHFIDGPPDLAADPTDTAGVRRFYRERAVAEGHGLIECDPVRVAGCAAVRIVRKLPQPSGGLSYLASLVLPFREFGFLVKVHCVERTTAGVREAQVLQHAMASGQVTRSEHGDLLGWARDPYGDAGASGLLWNLSDARTHDARFPDHALSRARSLLDRVEATLRIDDNVRAAPGFVYRGGKRPWWKRW
ncbi:hypothetical protein [Tahibacter caeni]|uniref:hypothetical protein n=1 Tax=Tahibacter caeni TaxID=1453545 RepID=UPI0021495A3C|nr:hypothetical protein [Tahibacter caeni]